jgi:hypothetical protein
LRTRHRSQAVAARAEIANKRQLAALLDAEVKPGHLYEPKGEKLVLLRDPSEVRYPKEVSEGNNPPKWLVCRAVSLGNPGHLVVLRHEHFAATSADATQWDAILDQDVLGAEIRNYLDN